jgi:hypothetical protein
MIEPMALLETFVLEQYEGGVTDYEEILRTANGKDMFFKIVSGPSPKKNWKRNLVRGIIVQKYSGAFGRAGRTGPSPFSVCICILLTAAHSLFTSTSSTYQVQ